MASHGSCSSGGRDGATNEVCMDDGRRPVALATRDMVCQVMSSEWSNRQGDVDLPSVPANQLPFMPSYEPSQVSPVLSLCEESGLWEYMGLAGVPPGVGDFQIWPLSCIKWEEFCCVPGSYVCSHENISEKSKGGGGGMVLSQRSS